MIVYSFSRHIINLWAYFGGLILFLIVLLNVFSTIGVIFSFAFPGDFELTTMGTAIAVFAFLPYCQLSASNVSADIFTSKASPNTINYLNLIGNILAFTFSITLFIQMYLGMIDQKIYGYTTTILQIPIWLAFIPILISLVLLVMSTIISIFEVLLSILNKEIKYF